MMPNLDFVLKVNDGEVIIVDEDGHKYIVDPWIAGVITAIVVTEGHAVSKAIEIAKNGLMNPEVVRDALPEDETKGG